MAGALCDSDGRNGVAAVSVDVACLISTVCVALTAAHAEGLVGSSRWSASKKNMGRPGGARQKTGRFRGIKRSRLKCWALLSILHGGCDTHTTCCDASGLWLRGLSLQDFSWHSAALSCWTARPCGASSHRHLASVCASDQNV